ncbi:Uncharacterized protein APZ42_003435 [Daphnia magna]|uniref:Uncharacterized protein n=1 Tax=Daphnia magna TaxID=35525 RepID=A0A0P5YXV4_9CRUS|nr:Uncharacterized protein APZ42_003435 [Daphnia magna]
MMVIVGTILTIATSTKLARSLLTKPVYDRPPLTKSVPAPVHNTRAKRKTTNYSEEDFHLS